MNGYKAKQLTMAKRWPENVNVMLYSGLRIERKGVTGGNLGKVVTGRVMFCSMEVPSVSSSFDSKEVFFYDEDRRHA